MTPFAGWQNFFVIVGSSAGALVGLQFVVITLIADMPIAPGTAQGGLAFSTPTIVHFGVVLLLSAMLSAPWHSITTPAVLWGFLGVCGAIYSVSVARRMQAWNLYQPVLEDWLFHFFLPFGAYGTLALSAWATRWYAREALFAVAAAALLLLFDGIHNAWDGVTYHVFIRREKKPGSELLP
jgi:hypothetical protein